MIEDTSVTWSVCRRSAVGDSGGVFFLTIGAVFLWVGGFLLDLAEGRDQAIDEAVQARAAYYHPQTQEVVWKAPDAK